MSRSAAVSRVLNADQDQAGRHLQSFGDRSFEPARVVPRGRGPVSWCYERRVRVRGRLVREGLQDDAIDYGFDGVVLALFEAHALCDLGHLRRRCGHGSPADRALPSSSRNSPLRPRTMGAITVMRSPGERAATRSTICSADCRVIGRWQFGQCGWPTRGPKQAEVIVDLSNRAYRGARASATWSSARWKLPARGRRWRPRPGRSIWSRNCRA